MRRARAGVSCAGTAAPPCETSGEVLAWGAGSGCSADSGEADGAAAHCSVPGACWLGSAAPSVMLACERVSRCAWPGRSLLRVTGLGCDMSTASAQWRAVGVSLSASDRARHLRSGVSAQVSLDGCPASGKEASLGPACAVRNGLGPDLGRNDSANGADSCTQRMLPPRLPRAVPPSICETEALDAPALPALGGPGEAMPYDAKFGEAGKLCVLRGWWHYAYA